MAVSAIPPIPLVSLTLNGRPIQVRASATLLLELMFLVFVTTLPFRLLETVEGV